MSNTEVGCQPAQPPDCNQTIGESLDERIFHCRKRLEELCILKAKAEASGLLGFPRRFVEQVIFS